MKTKQQLRADLVDAQRLLRLAHGEISKFPFNESDLALINKIEYHLFARCAGRTTYPHGAENLGKEPQ